METMATKFLRATGVDPGAVALRTPGGAVEITWAEYRDRAGAVAAALHAHGVGRADTVALMLVNRPEFHIVDTAALLLGAVPFSIYNTLPAEQISHLLHNSGARIVVCESEHLERIELARDGTAVEHVVCVDGLADFEQLGPADFDVEAAAVAVEPTDLATLVYTSGTTGPPKGVEITHAAIVGTLGAVAKVIPYAPGGRLISYLPAAHVGDRFFAHYVAIESVSTTTCVADARNVADALREVRPTSWAGVPRVWEKLKAALEARIAAEPDPARRAAVRRAMDAAIQKVREEQAAMWDGGPGPSEELLTAVAHADELVLAPLRAAIGLDAVEWAMSGGAPVAPETLEFFVALGIPVAETWGMSEMFAGTINPPGALKLGTVGPPIPEVDLRLADDGEILIRSPFVMRGYRHDAERTAEVVDADGWLHTGDIATVDEGGHVRIVDRKKELIINAGGKNMSPANIENTIKSASPLIGLAVVVGDRRPYNVALVVLDPEVAAGRMAAGEDVRAEVAAAIERANTKLSRVEQIKRFELLDEEWLPGGDELTPTMKLKRKPIAEKYAAVIEALYG